MQIQVNGEPRKLAGPVNLAALLADLNVPAQSGVAVLLNGDVVRKADWAHTTVQPADALEIVRATVGG